MHSGLPADSSPSTPEPAPIPANMALELVFAGQLVEAVKPLPLAAVRSAVPVGGVL